MNIHKCSNVNDLQQLSMNFKIDTREKFTIITPLSDFLSDSLTEAFLKLGYSFLQKQISLVINFKNVNTINEHFLKQIAALKEEFYLKNISFVLCEVNQTIMHLIKQFKFNDVLNITPTETEAWDMVQMEAIERELLNGEQ